MGLQPEGKDEGAQEEKLPSRTWSSCSGAAAAAQAPLRKSACVWCKLNPERLLGSLQ